MVFLTYYDQLISVTKGNVISISPGNPFTFTGLKFSKECHKSRQIFCMQCFMFAPLPQLTHLERQTTVSYTHICSLIQGIFSHLYSVII